MTFFVFRGIPSPPASVEVDSIMVPMTLLTTRRGTMFLLPAPYSWLELGNVPFLYDIIDFNMLELNFFARKRINYLHRVPFSETIIILLGFMEIVLPSLGSELNMGFIRSKLQGLCSLSLDGLRRHLK